MRASVAGFSAACACEYPRWCRLVSNRAFVDDDVFEITAEEPVRCCGCCGASWLCERSEEFPERVATTREPVTERDLQYLTIGIVVNAPYGRRGLEE